ncbi:MAG TPA: (4Fe-4S)-binding protein [Bacteroidales bacterium]|nr:(4Fe-4S)-binding protein [Bacteroidales bacterium]
MMESENKQFSGGRRYKNDEIIVYWKPSACVHASYCYLELIEVFDPGRRPWVDMSGAPTARIIEVVNMCPTEALTWKWNDDNKNKSVGEDQTNHVKFRRPELLESTEPADAGKPVSVKIMADGPVVVKGNFTFLYRGNIKEMKESMISLCRCGASHQMPFCDGQHRKIGFEDK